MDEEKDDDEEKQTIKKPLWNSFCRHRKCRGFTNSSAAKSLFYFLWTSLPFPQTYHPLNVYCLFHFLRSKEQHNWSKTYGSFARALNYIWPLVSFSNSNAHKNAMQVGLPILNSLTKGNTYYMNIIILLCTQSYKV